MKMEAAKRSERRMSQSHCRSRGTMMRSLCMSRSCYVYTHTHTVYMYFNLGVCVCVCRVGSGYALLKSHPRSDTRRMSSSAASTATAAAAATTSNGDGSSRLRSAPVRHRLWCTCAGPALASLQHENLSKLITHTSVVALWTRLADVLLAPRTPGQAFLSVLC